MIEGLLLPEVFALAGPTVDLCRREMQPRIELLFHRFLRGKRSKQMNVVGHDDKVSHPIATPVEVHQTVGHDVRQLRSPKLTFSVTSVQKAFPLAIEVLLKLAANLQRQLIQHLMPHFATSQISVFSLAAMIEPLILLFLPASENLFGNGVFRAKRHKVDRSGLGPVRPDSLANQQRSSRIKEFPEHGGKSRIAPPIRG